MIHIFQEESSWKVWTDCEEGDFKSGRCLSIAEDRNEALWIARRELIADLDVIWANLRSEKGVAA